MKKDKQDLWVNIHSEFFPQYNSDSLSSIRYEYFTNGYKILTVCETKFKNGKVLCDNGTFTDIQNPITVQIKKEDKSWVGLTLDSKDSIAKYKNAILNCFECKFSFNGNI